MNPCKTISWRNIPCKKVVPKFKKFKILEFFRNILNYAKTSQDLTNSNFEQNCLIKFPYLPTISLLSAFPQKRQKLSNHHQENLNIFQLNYSKILEEGKIFLLQKQNTRFPQNDNFLQRSEQKFNNSQNPKYQRKNL